jgi:hypothetical protein
VRLVTICPCIVEATKYPGRTCADEVLPLCVCFQEAISDEVARFKYGLKIGT